MNKVNEHGWVNDNSNLSVEVYPNGVCTTCDRKFHLHEQTLYVYTGEGFYITLCFDCIKSSYEVLSQLEEQRGVDAGRPRAMGM